MILSVKEVNIKRNIQCNRDWIIGREGFLKSCDQATRYKLWFVSSLRVIWLIVYVLLKLPWILLEIIVWPVAIFYPPMEKKIIIIILLKGEGNTTRNPKFLSDHHGNSYKQYINIIDTFNHNGKDAHQLIWFWSSSMVYWPFDLFFFFFT